MRLISASLLLTVLFVPVASVAGDKEEARSLAADADYLAQNSGEKGWVAEGVALTRDAGKKKAKAKLTVIFTATDGKPAGGLRMHILIEPEHGPKSLLVRGGQFAGDPYALVEKDGKRFIHMMQAAKGPLPAPEPKVVATLEYTIKADELRIKPDPILTGSGWELDPDKAIVFKPGKDWSGALTDVGLRKEAPTQIDADTGYVADAKAWEKLWTAWRGKKALPKIDFEKDLVLVVTVTGTNRVFVSPVLRDGDLRYKLTKHPILILPNKGFSGFSYYLAVQPRKDVKTISGKAIAAK